MIHQTRQFAHWIAVDDAEGHSPGPLAQIRDIVAGEESYVVYGTAKQMKNWGGEILLCDAAANQARRRRVGGGHGGARTAGSSKRLRTALPTVGGSIVLLDILSPDIWSILVASTAVK